MIERGSGKLMKGNVAIDNTKISQGDRHQTVIAEKLQNEICAHKRGASPTFRE